MELNDALNRMFFNSREIDCFGRNEIKSELSENSYLIWDYFDNNGLFPTYGWSKSLLVYLKDPSIYGYIGIGYLFKVLTWFSALLINESFYYEEYYAPLFECDRNIKKIIFEIQCFEDSIYVEDDQVSAFLPSLLSKMATMLVTLHLTNPYLAEEKRRRTQLNLLYRLSEYKEMECKRLIISNIEDAIEYASDIVEPTQEDKRSEGTKEIERRIKSQWKMKDVMIMYYMMKQNKERR